ncbi:MAG: ATP synthase subunit I [Actinobacteria bacterium]|nr:ATP synthase subunit I [Actinomycetota bacterium]
MTTALAQPVGGPAVEIAVARDLARRAVPLAPAAIGVCAVFWGLHGALSSAYGLVLVVANFMLAAALMTWAARISLAVMLGTVLAGYIARLAVLTLAVLAVRGAGWVELVPLGLTLAVTHLSLLVWEARHVSLTLAFPGLRPKG